MNNPVIPSNVEAEIALLGCLFLDENLMINVNDEIVFQDFYDSKNRELFKVMKMLYSENKNIDITTVSSEIIASDKLGLVGGLDYINTIANFTYSTSNIDSYISLVKEASLKRLAIDSLNKLVQKGYDGSIKATDYINQLESEIFELSKRRKTEQLEIIKDVLVKVQENTERNFENKEGITGLNTGFSNLNKLTLGLQKENLIILAARPAMGKSAFAMNLAVQVAESNMDGKANVAIFSLEMGADQLVERMIACDSSIHLTKLKKGSLSATDWRLFSASSNKLGRLNIYFDDSANVTVSNIRTKCRKLASEHGLDFVIIDYLQLIEGDEPGKSKHEEVSKISRSLKLMARELKIPVLALAQLSREVEKRDEKKPIMADLRDSGSIEQDADIVMFLYREDYYKKNSERPNEADLIVAKNRSGSAGVELKYIFQGGYSKFEDNDKEGES